MTTPEALYTGADYQRAADTIRRIGTCHDQRIAADVSDRPGRAVAAARLAVDLVETATTAELRAMVVQLTTPELRPAVPVVVVSGCTCGVMTGGIRDPRRSCPRHGVDELEQQYRDSPGARGGVG